MGRTETVGLLLDRGAHIEQSDRDGKTGLMWAAQNGRLDTVELLLKRGARVNVRDNKGNTAQSWAKQSKRRKETRKKIKEVLLKAGAAEEKKK